MLTIFDPRDLHRRAFLQVGGFGLAGALTGAASAGETSHIDRGKSVVYLFMHGGPSQYETFDPNMQAPAEIRSATGEVKTNLPGVTLAGSLPKLAQRADRLAIVRSFTTGNGNHDIKPIVSSHSLDANIGSLIARALGNSHPQTGMPSNVLLFPRAVNPDRQAGIMKFGKFNASGELGPSYKPFSPSGGGDLQNDMQLKLPANRVEDRRMLLAQIDARKNELKRFHQAGQLDSLRAQAFDTILGGVSQAFDLSHEDPQTIRRYDTANLVTPSEISRKWNNYNHYVDHGNTVGKLLLLARRLCEAGARFVTVTTNFVWDMHADANNADVVEGSRYCARPFDHAVSTFIDDVAERGLSDKILLVCSGEMGRGPKINAKGGRDHWGGIAPLLLSGGGLNMGQVIGQSTRDGGKPLTEPQGIPNLISTLLHTTTDMGQLRLERDAPRDLLRLAAAQPIPGLF